MTKIDDLIEPGLEQIVSGALPSASRFPPQMHPERESCFAKTPRWAWCFAGFLSASVQKLANPRRENGDKALSIRRLDLLHGRELASAALKNVMDSVWRGADACGGGECASRDQSAHPGARASLEFACTGAYAASSGGIAFLYCAP